jgi:hypothetical protein
MTDPSTTASENHSMHPVPPFVPVGRGDYTACYNPLYALIKENKLDFGALAQQMGMKERRLREAFLFRLGSGEVRQLFGYRPGWCYLCQDPVDIAQEPICFPCLRTAYRFSTDEDSRTPAPPRFGFERRRSG